MNAGVIVAMLMQGAGYGLLWFYVNGWAAFGVWLCIAGYQVQRVYFR